MRGAERFTRAVHARQRESAARDRTRQADVLTISPLRVELDTGEQLDRDELTFSADAAAYLQDPGLQSGDCLILQPVDDDLLVTSIRPA